MAIIGLRELRQDASAIVRRVEEGERIDITVSGRLAAQIVPLARGSWLPWDAIADVFSGAPDTHWERDRELIDDDIRDPWTGE
jgi:prevent-host-death family protein